MRRLLPVAALVLIVAAILASIWLAGRGHEVAAPQDDQDLLVPSRLPGGRVGDGQVMHPAGSPVEFSTCAEGYGWQRPSLDDQRRHLTSLGGEFQQYATDAALLFDGASRHGEWRYGLWAVIGDIDREQYALARTGLWGASPNSDSCDRTGELTLLIDRQVTAMLWDGESL